MIMGQSAPVELRVTLDAERMAGLAARIKAPGTTTVEQDDLARVLITSLDSTSFKVSPSGPQRQQVLPGKDAVWLWAIEPLEPGDNPLVLTIKSELPGGDAYTPLVRTIRVKALPPPSMQQKVIDFVVKNWDKLLTLVLIPLGAFGWKTWKSRRRDAA